MARAKEAGARYVVGSALRLGPAARHRFLPVLAREFPELAERYARHYARREGVSPAYQRALSGGCTNCNGTMDSLWRKA